MTEVARSAQHDLLRALRRTYRALARETDEDALVRSVVAALVDVCGIRAARVVLRDAAIARDDERAVPIEADGHRRGTLLVALSGEADVETLDVLRELGEDIALALARIEAVGGLRTREEHVRAALEVAPVGIARADASTGRLLSANDRMCALLGYSEQELCAMDVDDFTHPDDRARDRAARDALVAGEVQATHVEKRYVTKDGRAVWVSVHATMRRDADGRTELVATIEDLSARRASEALLHLHASALEATAHGIVITNATGVVEWVNEAFTRLTGYEPEEVIGRSPQILKSGRHDDEFYRRMWTTILAGNVWRGDIVNRRKDGSLYDEEQTITPVRDEDGAIRHFVAVKQDVSQRKRADERLRASEERLRVVLESLPVPIGISTDDGSVLFLNEAFTRRFGFTRADLPTLVDFVAAMFPDPSAGAAALAIWAEHLQRPEEEQSNYTQRLRMTCKDGSVRDVDAMSRRIGTTMQVSSFTDVTERERAVAVLTEAQERCQLALDAVEQGTFRLDATTSSLTLDARARTHFGVRRPDATMEDLVERCHADDRELFERALAAVVVPSGDGRARMSLRVVLPTGETRWLRVHLRTLFGGEGARRRALYTIATTQDVTDAKATEEHLRASQRMEAIGRLAGGVAHDFNNLLSVILSYGELAVESLADSEPLRQDLEEIVSAAKRAEGLTRQLLAFSRHQVLQPEPIELDALIGSLAKMLKRLIGEDVDLDIVAADGLRETRADRGQIEQLVMNLVVNARDAMPDGGRLTISTSNASLDEARAAELDVAPGRYVRLTVADTGCGMDAATLSRIFEPFFTTKAVGKGTGLGLSMVYGIVRQSGGAITVESTPGNGTRFDVYLPWYDWDEVAPSVRGTSLRPPRANDETILVVDDEAAMLSVVRRVLAAAGYEVLTAANAGEALLVCEQRGTDIDLVLTDVVMPGLSGPRLVDRIAPLCPSARVVFMSGYTGDALDRHDLSGARFIRKPFDGRTLSSRVREVLDGG